MVFSVLRASLALLFFAGASASCQQLPDSTTCVPALKEGRSTVFLVVTKGGQPTNPKIAKSSGDACIDSRALETVMTYRFKPLGKKIDMTIVVAMKIDPKDSPKATVP